MNGMQRWVYETIEAYLFNFMLKTFLAMMTLSLVFILILLVSVILFVFPRMIRCSMFTIRRTVIVGRWGGVTCRRVTSPFTLGVGPAFLPDLESVFVPLPVLISSATTLTSVPVRRRRWIGRWRWGRGRGWSRHWGDEREKRFSRYNSDE